MKIGVRVTSPEQLMLWQPEAVQISLYKNNSNNLRILKDCVCLCKHKGIHYVIHPVSYDLLDDNDFVEIMKIAEWTNGDLILHDVCSSNGEPLKEKEIMELKKRLTELQTMTKISFENAIACNDVIWFWENFAHSITLDIGHLEVKGFDSMQFVEALNEDIIKKIDYVHIHKCVKMETHTVDHLPLEKDCKELRTLEALLARKPSVTVFLEINDIQQIENSMWLLTELKNK